MWEKVEVCSLLKAFHVPIAVRKVHYVGKGGGGEGAGQGMLRNTHSAAERET